MGPRRDGRAAARAATHCGVCAQSAGQWKSESDETVKTRRNALRVIVQKLRNFWPVQCVRARAWDRLALPALAQPRGCAAELR